MTDLVNLLCDIAEAPVDTFRASELHQTSGTATQTLIRIGVLEPGPPCQTVTCQACHGDHVASVEFDSVSGRSVHFCPEAGIVTVNDADLATLWFNPEWLVDWLIRELHISWPVQPRVIIPQQVWHLGDVLHGAAALAVFFARRLGNLATIDHLASAFGGIPTIPVGLVVTSSMKVPRRVASLRRYEFLDLREIVHAKKDGLVLNKTKFRSWIDGYQLASMNQNQLSARGTAGGGRPRRDPARLDYHVEDQPLIEEMQEMILCGDARNATDAARAIAKRAAGAGKEASKVTRLATGYLKQYVPE